MKILVLIASLVLGSAVACAHDAPSGWRYPDACCHDSDCGVAIRAVRNGDGSLTITTKHGTATFPPGFKYEPSPDGLIHACFTSARLYGLYLSTGI